MTGLSPVDPAAEARHAEVRREELLRVVEALAVARVRAGAVLVPEVCVEQAQKLIKLVNSLKPWPR
jgi:hypothetical protein